MNNPNNGAWYALRRTLPPWRFEETLADLIELAPQFQVDEVIVKIDTEEFSHGHPDLAWTAAYQEKLFRIKEALESRGIVYSLNPWITVGHADRGRDDRLRLPGMEYAVGHDGATARHCTCFLSPVWRDYLRQLWRIYAETKPHIMWVEDDIRTFNHEPVRFGCFCERHMELFSRRVGRPVGREELVAALLQPGKPHPWRTEYLQMQRDVMVETAAFLAQITHDVSPDSCMGLMSSGPRLHCVEGRDWKKLATALADGKPLYSRPPMDNYYEDSLRGFYYSQDSIKVTRQALPEGVIEQTECENVPFSRFSKSVTFTFLETAISFAYGSHGVTLNLFDHVGTPMKSEEHFGRMLAEKKAFLSALGSATRQEGKFHGIRLFHVDDAGFSRELEAGADYGVLHEDGFELMRALESHGIPTTYADSPVAALAGQTVRALSDAEITALLHRGLFLDGVAARILVERGYGEQIGMHAVDAPVHRRELPWVISAEELYNTDFGGCERKYLTATLPFLGSDSRFCRLEPTAGARIVSAWADPDTVRVAPAMTAFENTWGGRVVVHAPEYRSAFGVSFCHPFRREQLQSVMDYLAYGCADIAFSCDGAYALAWRKTARAETIVGCFNLNLDAWQDVLFTLAWTGSIPKLQRLNADGVWVSAPEIRPALSDGRLQLAGQLRVNHEMPLVLKLI